LLGPTSFWLRSMLRVRPPDLLVPHCPPCIDRGIFYLKYNRSATPFPLVCVSALSCTRG
jgi:hypothetical protein